VVLKRLRWSFLDCGIRAEPGMPERNDRNTQACRHSRRRCAVAGQAEATNKSLNRKKRPARTSGPGRKALLSLTQTRVAQHPQARIPNHHDSSTEEFGACHADVISTPHDSMRCCDQGPRLGANAFSGRISSCHQSRPRCSRMLDAGLACVLADAFVKH